MSAGGTSLSVFMGAIGILCNVGRQSENTQNAFVFMKFNIFKVKQNKAKRLVN